MTFRIFDVESGGTFLWDETLPCTTSAGYFGAIFTNVNLPFDEDYWLEIEINSEILDPRQKLGMVGYAARADTADYAFSAPGGGGSNWTVTDSVLYTNDYWGIARGNAGNVLFGDSAHTMINLGVSCTTGASGTDREYATVGGGYSNTAGGNASTVAGGSGNSSESNYSGVGGGLENVAEGNNSIVGGGNRNSAHGGSSTIGGGYSNSADGAISVIGGGTNNIADGAYSSVVGGYENTANGWYSTIGGGKYNTTGGQYSAVSGGIYNTANGDYSFAAGFNAKANHDGSVVIAAVGGYYANDSVRSGGDDQMVLRATGGLYITPFGQLAPYDNTKLITTYGGAYLSGYGTNWTNSSDRNRKENFTPVSGPALLQKLESLEISEWNYKEDDQSVRHIGAVAQDFYAIFGLGNDDKSISTVDPSGVALAGIKELVKTVNKLSEENKELRSRIEELETRIK